MTLLPIILGALRLWTLGSKYTYPDHTYAQPETGAIPKRKTTLATTTISPPTTERSEFILSQQDML